MFKHLDNKVKLFMFLVYGTAFFSIIYAFQKYGVDDSFNTGGIVFFAVLSIIAESFNVQIKSISISTGFTITIASILFFNPFISIVIISVGIAFRIVKIEDNVYSIFNVPFYKTLFNVSTYIISTVISSQAYELAGGKYGIENFHLEELFIPLVLFVGIYFFINNFMIYYAVYITSKVNLNSLIIPNLTIGLLSIFAMAPLGIILAVAFRQYNYLWVIIIFIPMLLARYCFMLYINTKKAYLDTVKALSLAIEAKDKYTEGHSMRVKEYVEKIARKMNFSESHIDNLKISSMLHDIGKIGIPESILNKPGKLSDSEYTIIKDHTIIGANIVKNVDGLKNTVDIIKYHHEHYDGSGYPCGLKGDAIPLDPYIVAAADAFDAMCSDRPYRKAMSKAQAASILEKEKGKQFHPRVVDAFLEILKSEGVI